MTNEVKKNLENILATSYGLALKTQNYHWNVTGPNFKSLHELFGLQYEEISLAIDVLAERIRMLGSKVEGTFAHFEKLSSIKAGDKNLDSIAMVKDLVAGNRLLIKMLKEGIDVAEENNDKATADILTTRVEAHDKNAWMLESSI